MIGCRADSRSTEPDRPRRRRASTAARAGAPGGVWRTSASAPTATPTPTASTRTVGESLSAARPPAEHDGATRDAGAARTACGTRSRKVMSAMHGDEAEQVARAEDALDRAELRDVALDAEEAERHVEEDAREDLDAERDREQHAQHVAERARGLQGVAHVPDRRPRGTPAPPSTPSPRTSWRRRSSRTRSRAPSRGTATSVVGHEAHERDLLAPGDQHPDRRARTSPTMIVT